MIRPRHADEIVNWGVIFYPSSPTLIGRLVPGHFKHVALMAYSPGTNTWLFQEVNFDGCRVIMAPNTEEGQRVLDGLTAGASILQVRGRKDGRRVIWRGPLTCVSFARHAVGSWCVSIYPTAFYRALIRNGAIVVQGDGPRTFWGRWRRWFVKQPHDDDGHAAAAGHAGAAGASRAAAEPSPAERHGGNSKLRQ